MDEKALDSIEYALYQAGLLPINDKTGEGTALRKMIDDQWELYGCLYSAHAKVGLVLRNGMTIEGSLYKMLGPGFNKLRVKIGKSSDEHGVGKFVDTWPRQVIAVKFELASDFGSIGFQPYLEKQASFYDVSRQDLSEVESNLFWDTYDLASYLLHGKYSVDKVGIMLTNGMEFTGSLELVRNDRVLLYLGSTDEVHTYLDVHPLTAISAVRFEVGAKGWPYAPD